MPKRNVFAVSSIALFLFGCTTNVGPSIEEIQNALKKYHLQNVRESMGASAITRALGNLSKIEQINFSKIEKIACTDVSPKAATCELYLEFVIGEAGSIVGSYGGIGVKQSGHETLRFIKINGEWMVGANK